MPSEPKSCANCRHLSPPVVVEFANRKIVEERVVCLANEWQASVVSVNVYWKHPERYRAIAKKCEKFAQAVSSPVEKGILAEDKK